MCTYRRPTSGRQPPPPEPPPDVAVSLFSESNGRYLVEVSPAHHDVFLGAFSGCAAPRLLGEVTAHPALVVDLSGGGSFSLALDALRGAWMTEA